MQGPIVHVFHSSLISGPETLVLPTLAPHSQTFSIWWLREERIEASQLQKVETYFQSLGLRYQVIPIRARWDWKALGLIATLLQSAELKLVHAHDVKASLYLAWAKALAKLKNGFFFQGPPLVTTHHGVNARSGFLNKVYERLYVQVGFPFFNKVCVVCSTDQALLVQRGVPSSKISVHLNGVDRPYVAWDQKRRELQQGIRQAWGFSLSQQQAFQGLWLGVAARLSPEKNHQGLLQLLARIKRPDLRVLLFGQGPLQQQLEHDIQQLGLKDQVYLMGHRSTLTHEFAGFDLLLSLSHAEGLPINVLEAGWAGVPVCATLVDGMNDLYQGNQDFGCFLNPQADMAEWCLKFQSFLEEAHLLPQRGQRWQAYIAQHFSSRVWWQRLLQIYQEVGVTVYEAK